MIIIRKISLFVLSIVSVCFSLTDSLNNIDTLKSVKRGDIVGFPFFCYAPETGIAGGGRLAYFWKNGSNLYVNIFISQKMQFELFFGGELYKKEWKFIPKLKGSYWTDTYYGLGSVLHSENKENYNERFLWGYFSAQRKFGKIYSGFDFDSRIEKTKQLSGDPPGSGYWYIFALGTRNAYDTRNNVNYPSDGYFVESIYRNYLPIARSLDYNKFILDFRLYKTLFLKTILAYQLKLDISTNGTPIQLMPSVGDVLRGYNQSYYKDNVAITTQLEGRYPIWKKISGAIFCGAGDVYGKYNFNISRLKIAGGLGLRYKLTDSKVNLRFDYAINREFDSSFYVDLCEAF